MPDAPDEARRDSRSATERAAFSAAREHVGAAGFAQRDTLEQLISAGREQIEFTHSLRQVMKSTLEQLHALPPADLHHAAGTQVTALENIVQASRAQLETAHRLREAIQRTMAEICGTPVEDISAHLLRNLSQVVQRQAADLDGLIKLALHEASTVQQIDTLSRMSAEAQTQLLRTDREQVEGEILELTRLGQDALERIRALEASGITYAAQREQLECEDAAARAHIAGLEANAARDAHTITRMEGQLEASRAHTAELEAAARKTQEKIARLREQLEAQHNHDHELIQRAEEIHRPDGSDQ
ncbi:hypothetical protein [Deinococcus peraridilitoris]|uniref:Uncharacterized protein n=1 Tax=Deinococcus peraridilitoris (strain DSM 19664 / LMG 22246 / CIP 109416 / KR-200) TaxID=937777 RepID=L0A5X5_DEIPD|nr:hypothetical protein [Deinococcus peraridilitoris]AFZ69251.1 hypothetical protein Deipe_3828 [Deinococcus peraridilitoris DSM 19664]